ncbi:hypothetical protein ElyMa_000594400 [Elysia marginata]|uniref:Uncharacterized protein n=1 Tax=Elysia marginata TaxID=1093978 RepID=A0AAV4G758_9GAST|nr:hypothetical protein ElyMa_000594400 [Elysia marginata]
MDVKRFVTTITGGMERKDYFQWFQDRRVRKGKTYDVCLLFDMPGRADVWESPDGLEKVERAVEGKNKLTSTRMLSLRMREMLTSHPEFPRQGSSSC